ncbi:MAG: hypothetical protein UY52_C0001G0096 [Parcubacteria group bacterium GW2011_GWC2_49_9]|nr:MAG: hypothetical protein UY52_C0001G0096 [Parcubacteria group bacterium GW2011_GWC2_49_9]
MYLLRSGTSRRSTELTQTVPLQKKWRRRVIITVLLIFFAIAFIGLLLSLTYPEVLLTSESPLEHQYYSGTDVVASLSDLTGRDHVTAQNTRINEDIFVTNSSRMKLTIPFYVDGKVKVENLISSIRSNAEHGQLTFQTLSEGGITFGGSCSQNRYYLIFTYLIDKNTYYAGSSSVIDTLKISFNAGKKITRNMQVHRGLGFEREVFANGRSLEFRQPYFYLPDPNGAMAVKVRIFGFDGVPLKGATAYLQDEEGITLDTLHESSPGEYTAMLSGLGTYTISLDGYLDWGGYINVTTE